MLETTFATTFVPGSNLRGEVSGANWLFVLPALALEHSLCLGQPAPTTLHALRRASRRLSLVLPPGTTPPVDGAAEGTLLLAHSLPLPVAAQQFDLIYIAGRNGAAWLARRPAWQRELRRVLKAQGWLYCESAGLVPGWLVGWQAHRLERAFHGGQRLWLTPFHGEMQTAVPAQDRQMRAWFVRERLYVPAVDFRVFKRLLRRASSATEARTAPPQGGAIVGGRTRHALWRLLSRAVQLGEATEHWLRCHHLMWGGQRHALLLGAGTSALAEQPPAYLCRLAAAAGIELNSARWSLSARGEYNSRKVVFFVQPAAARQPEYVVKMTRDASLNGRLENEYRALSALQQRGIDRCLALPRVCFFGYHHGLAVLGQTLVAGQPFEQCSRGQPTCPHALATVEWLTQLAERTMGQRVAASALADRLAALVARLETIYHLDPGHQRFLAQQIERLRLSQSTVPLVFQHGDPGTWNILVQPDGRIALLDWEAAEPQGVPLWDLFYFLRAFAVWSGRVHGLREPLRAVAYHVLRPAALHEMLVAAIAAYSRRLALDPALIAPLFYTCWVHRALKEATRLPVEHMEQGHYIQLLRVCIEAATSPALQRIFEALPSGALAAAHEQVITLQEHSI